MWAISDEERILHTGTEDEMCCAYQVMTWSDKVLKQMHQETRLAELKEKYRVPHKGKLTLGEI